MPHTCTQRLLALDLAPHGPVAFPKIREELLSLAKKDQLDRERWSAAGNNDTEIRKDVATHDKVRTARLLEILGHIESPAAVNVGLDGTRAVWLLAQHSNAETMELVLKKFRYLYAKNKQNVFYQGIPYLSDRTRIMKGLKQRYGTQYFVDKDGTSRKFPVSNPKSLVERRAAYGLCTEGDCGRA